MEAVKEAFSEGHESLDDLHYQINVECGAALDILQEVTSS